MCLGAVLVVWLSAAGFAVGEGMPERDSSRGRARPVRVEAKQVGEQWILSNDRLRVSVEAGAGALSVLDKGSGHLWEQAPKTAEGGEGRFRKVRPTERGIEFEADYGSGEHTSVALRVSLALDGPDMTVEADTADRTARIEYVPFLAALVLDDTSGAVVVPTDGNGHLYPLERGQVPADWWAVGDMDMPWIGVCDLEKGFGYMIIADTSDDAAFWLEARQAGGREVWAPRVAWQSSMGEFRYPRRLTYHFSSRGGYVALAKRYRRYVSEHGLLLTLAEKRRRNPNVARLYGAPDIWGDASIGFARAAKAAGVAKMLLHGSSPSGEMKEINDFGYLTSCYDNYTDVLPVEPGKGIDGSHEVLPDRAVLQSDGERMKAWLTMEGQQFMKRCPTFWVPTARVVVPQALAASPYLGRFVDVTTAEGLYECYDPKHPLTRGEKRQCGVDLLAYVSSLGLVVGGEHGKWWGVPQLDYVEGMMSGGSTSWPAGYLIRPKSKDQKFKAPGGWEYPSWDQYEQWGIGHERRVPLWELVFHDCVVTTWYWGDSSDFLLEAAPEVTAKKNAFNILYGTIPMMWSDREESWVQNRKGFLRSYRNTCKLHEAVAEAEMVSHEFVTADRAVQRTRFSDGTEVVVNFGEKPREVEVGGRKRMLPQNGFAIKGPRIDQSRSLEDGKVVTRIKAAGYEFKEGE